jgi:hypothetical protein
MHLVLSGIDFTHYQVLFFRSSSIGREDLTAGNLVKKQSPNLIDYPSSESRAAVAAAAGLLLAFRSVCVLVA